MTNGNLLNELERLRDERVEILRLHHKLNYIHNLVEYLLRTVYRSVTFTFNDNNNYYWRVRVLWLETV